MGLNFIERFVEWKHYNLAAAILIIGSFVGYWCGVSGFLFMWEFKLGLMLLPFMGYGLYRIYKYISKERARRMHQQEIINNARIRRLLDRAA